MLCNINFVKPVKMWFISNFIIFCIVSITILFHWKMLALYKYTKVMSGSIVVPFFGNSLYFLGSSEDVLNKLRQYIRRYRYSRRGIRLWVGNFLGVFIVTPEDVKIVLNDPQCQKKSIIYKTFELLIGRGLFCSNKLEEMKMHRKDIISTMTPASLKSYVNIWVDHSRKLCERLSKEVGKLPFDPYTYLSHYRMHVTGETMFGTKYIDEAEVIQNSECLERCLSTITMRILKPWLYVDAMFKLTSEGATCFKMAEILQEFAKKIVNEKIVEYQDKTGYWKGEQRKFKSALESLVEMHSQKQISFIQIVDEVVTILVGAADAPCLTECFTLMMLGMHQELQEEVFQEMRHIFGNSDRPCEAKDLHRMDLLERFIKETIRLFPVATLLARYSKADINMATYVIPKHTNIAICTIELHRNPEVWEEPLRFDPDRFLPERFMKMHPYSFLPFSGGPRICIGPKYAMMSMMCNISTILRKYKIFCQFKSVEDIQLKFEFMLKPVDGFLISLECR